MIPVQGYADKTLAVLGLGRSGRATAAALNAGGGQVVVWDDSAQARELAAADGLEIRDLTKSGAFDGIVKLIVSPGIPHLYPQPNPVIAAAWEAGVPVDNDIGLFFQSFASDEWGDFDRYPKVVCITGSNGKSTTSALLHHIMQHAKRPGVPGPPRGAASLFPGRKLSASVCTQKSCVNIA